MKKLVQSFFSKLPHHFRHPKGFLGRLVGRRMDEINDSQNEWIIPLLDIQKDDTILEIGFGTGKTIQKLTKLMPDGKIAGLDASETMLKVASKRNRHSIKSGQATLHVGDVTSLPFKENSFDTVFEVHVLYFIEDLKKAFEEIRRVLRKDGTVVLYFAYPAGKEKPGFTWRSPEEIIHTLKQAGFKKIRHTTKSFKKATYIEYGNCITATKT